jgi:para-nitrobenzyl esterase
MSTMTTLSLTGGRVRGSSTKGIDSYLGIPYAAPPSGELRFALPAPHPSWSGERDATKLGATAPQAPYRGAIGTLLPTVIIEGDDYLNLNVWAPSGSSGLPVMVWVHGGSFAHGSNALPGYDGTTFARDGVVFVAVNYRLGPEGFSVLDGAPLNLGIADVAAALRWVQSEIATFGGDPKQVTVFGQSAGSILLSALAAHPDASELFARAILMSGAPGALPLKRAALVTRLTAKRLNIAATRDSFTGVSAAELVAASDAVMAGGTPITGGPAFGPALGGELVPQDPLKAVLAGAGNDIPLLIGSTSEEYRLWFVPSGLLDKITPVLFAAARLRFRIGRRILQPYRANRPGASRGVIFGALATDILLRLPVNRVADARLKSGAKTHVYEFTWPSPVLELGAAHAIELGFVFDGLHESDWSGLVGREAPQQLADDMHGSWIRFAKTGDPGWEPWSALRPVQTFDAPKSAVVYAPREDERAGWR